jgi:nucleoside-diphosphate-sugar epimerase
MAKWLQGGGHEVLGLTHHPQLANPAQGLFHADLADATALSEVLKAVVPDWVVHLAAIAFVAHGKVDDIYRTNVVGTRNLLEAVATQVPTVQRVLLASSANVYGNSTEGVLTEATPPAPANDYAVSKLAMEYVAGLYQPRLPLVMARPFNYTGVGQAVNFLIPKIVDHFARRASVIELGNLEVARDFSDVRRVVHAYGQLLSSPAERVVGQVFNVCSEVPTSLMDVLALAQEISGHALEIRVNPAFVRANEVRSLTGSCARLVNAVGELPRFALADTLRWMLGKTAD